MRFERFAAIHFRVIASLLIALAGLSLVIAASEASFDGKRLDIQTMALLSGGVAYVVVRLWGLSQSPSVEAGFVGGLVGAVFAAVTQDASGETLRLLISATAYGMFALFLRIVVIPWLEAEPSAWSRLKSRFGSDRSDGIVGPEAAPDTTNDIERMLTDTERRLREAGRHDTFRAGVAAGVVAVVLAFLLAGRRQDPASR
jgi:hypothetical protein